MPEKPLDFAPIPRKRKLTEEQRRKAKSKGGQKARGQAKNHWTPTEWKALSQLALRARWDKHRAEKAKRLAEANSDAQGDMTSQDRVGE